MISEFDKVNVQFAHNMRGELIGFRVERMLLFSKVNRKKHLKVNLVITLISLLFQVIILDIYVSQSWVKSKTLKKRSIPGKA